MKLETNVRGNRAPLGLQKSLSALGVTSSLLTSGQQSFWMSKAL